MLDKIKSFFTECPEYFGLLFMLFGIIMLVCSIKGSKWLSEKDATSTTYSQTKSNGLFNSFGKKATRIILALASVLIILFGIFWFWANGCY